MYVINNEEYYSHQAPAVEDPCQNCLFRVVRDMWSKAIDCAVKVSIRTLYNIRGCHE